MLTATKHRTIIKTEYVFYTITAYEHFQIGLLNVGAWSVHLPPRFFTTYGSNKTPFTHSNHSSYNYPPWPCHKDLGSTNTTVRTACFPLEEAK